MKYWIFLVVGLLFSCDKSKSSTAAPPRESPQVNSQAENSDESHQNIIFALDWTPNTNHTGLYVAQKLGYFAGAGLKVEIIMPQSSATQLVAANRVQFAIGFQEFSTSSIGNEGVDIVSVAAVTQHNTSGFTWVKDRDIQRPRDFAGKLYAGWGDSFETTLIRYLIQADGGDPEQFRSVSIGEASIAVLLRKKVDYAWTYAAWQNIGFELQGLEVEFMPLRKLNPIFDYYTPIIMTSRSYLKAHEATARHFIRALAKGYEYAAAQPQKAAEILLEYAPELDRQLVLRSQQYISPLYLKKTDPEADLETIQKGSGAGKWGYQDPLVWDTLALWMYDKNLTKNLVRSEDAMSNKLLEF